jgi:pimeloyl-ACP methyl ester carboxylesterase
MTERHDLVDVGGHRLDLRVAGEGSPAVICLSSSGGAHEQWEKFVPLLSDTTTVVTYGRPALASSDPLPADLRGVLCGGAWPAEQLRTLLAAAEIPPPYVLVTGSIGGYIGDQYAALWPDEVAGLVLIDPTPLREFPGVIRDPDIFDDSDPPWDGLRISRQMAYVDQRDRMARNRDGRFVVLSAAVGRWLRNTPMDWHQPLTLAEVDAHWVVMQREWVRRLEATPIVADRAGHRAGSWSCPPR